MKLIVTLLTCILICLQPAYGQELEHDKKLRVGIYDNPPKVFFTKQGDADGVFIDVLKSIAEKENIHLEYVHDKWPNLMDMLLSGEIDVLPDMVFSPQRDSIYNLSIPLLSTWLQVYTTSKIGIHNIEDLQGKKIGVISNSRQKEVMEETALKNRISCEIIPYDDYYTLAHAIKKSEIDLIVAYRFFYFSELCGDVILPTSLILQVTELHYGFSRFADKELKIAVDRNILELKNNPKSDLYTSLIKWYNKDINMVPVWVIWLIVIILTCLIIVLIFVALLRKQVENKTKSINQKSEELLIAKERAEESDQLKTLFLQNMSHEIRTPMNSIIGFIELLQNSGIKESQKRYLEIISTSGARLMNTINSLLEISSIESNQIKINRSAVNFNDLLRFQKDVFAPQAIKKELELEVTDLLPIGKCNVLADKTLLSGVFNNLINNAIKFTENGFVKIGAYLNGNSIVIYVKDTGIGIPKDRQDAIFERFVFADLTLSRPNEGLGLGLSIVKAYAELLHGKVWVESVVDEGSTFFFELPFEEAFVESSMNQ
jgi:signal transduction histidine kinase